MAEATQTMKKLVQELGDVYGLECYMTLPNGEQFQYSRIIDKDFWDDSSQEAREFFGDDMVAAFKRITDENL